MVPPAVPMRRKMHVMDKPVVQDEKARQDLGWVPAAPIDAVDVVCRYPQTTLT